MADNPNWPRLQSLWALAGHIGYGPSAASYEVLPWVDVTSRLIGPWQINRGRQYELDQVTTGTWSGVLDNRDGLFDPDNTASAVSGDVVPYQPFRVRAQWPVTANLLSPGASGAEQGGQPVDPVAAGWDATSAVAFDSIASATAFTGSRVIQAVVPPSISGVNLSLTVPVTPGAAYSFSIRIRSTAGTAPQAAPTIGFFTATGTFWPASPVGSAVTVTTGTGWTTLTISGTAPALLGYATVGVQLFGPTASYTVQLDGAQFEQAVAPTGYVAPGVWYPLFTGGIERYPQTWRASGTLGYIQATAVDALALLSQSKLDDPFIAAAFKPPGGPTPTFAYLLADSAGSFLDATGQRAVAQLNPNLYGAGTATPGSPVTSVTPGGTFVCPTGMTVVNLTCDPDFAVPGGGFPGPFTYIRIPPSNAGAIGPGSAGAGRARAQLAQMPPFRKPASPATIHRIRAVLRSALTDASYEQLITINPAKLVKLPSGKSPKALVWTPARVKAWQNTGVKPSPVMVWTAGQTAVFLRRATKHRLYALYLLIAHCGLRRGEACGLRWQDLDLDNGTMTITQQIVQVGWDTTVGETKTDSGERTVALSKVVVKALRDRELDQARDKRDHGAAWTETGLVFTRRDGTALHPARITDQFTDLAREAGLPPVRLHDVRHGTATHLLTAGIEMKVVSEILGHSSTVITADLYTSVVDELKHAAADAIADTYSHASHDDR